MNKNIKGLIILLITALIWGTTFIMQKKATLLVGAFTFNFFRSIVGTILLTIITFLTRNKFNTNNNIEENLKEQKKHIKKVYIFSILAGVGMALGATLQQLGLETCDAGTSAFLTSVYIVFTPILGIAFGKKTTLKIWICAICALVGAYVLANGTNFLSFDLSLGSILILVGGIFWALQINAIDVVANEINPFKLCAIELIVTSFVSFIGMIIVDDVVMKNVIKALPYILYAGILSSTISFACQNIGQKYCEPTIATLIMSLESIFALISGIIFLNESLEINEIIGSIIIFSSVIIAQISFNKIFKKQI